MAKGAATLAELAAGIVSGGIRVVDLTVPLEPATPTIQLLPTGAVVIAPPLKIVNGSGNPLRVLALVPG